MGFQDVMLLPSRASFQPHFLKRVAEVKAYGPPHVLKLRLGVSKGMLPVEYFLLQQSLFVSVEFRGDNKTVTKLR